MEEKAKKVEDEENLENDEEIDEDEDELEDEDIDDDDVSDDDIDEDDDEDEEEDEDDDEPSSKKSQKDEEKEKQKAKNARFAEMRRKKETEEKAKREAEEKEKERKIRDDATLKAKLDVLKTNPYTEEPILDEEDLKIYEIQKELDEEGKDPINDLPKRLAEKNRKHVEEEKKSREEKENLEKKKTEKIRAEINELREKYPKVNTAELANDPLYQECLNGRAGRWTQVEIYELYLQKKDAAAAKAKADKQKKVVEENGSKISKTPSSKANAAVTSKAVSDMSDEEFDKYWAEKYGN